MAGGVNKVILIGNLGKDPEVRYTQAGNAVSNLRLAVTESRKDGDGWADATEWIDVVCFGKTAENAGQYLSKGRAVYVDGRMQTRKWKDRDGNDRWSTEVVANRLVFLGGGQGGEGGSAQGKGSSSDRRESRAPESSDGHEEDMPF